MLIKSVSVLKNLKLFEEFQQSSYKDLIGKIKEILKDFKEKEYNTIGGMVTQFQKSNRSGGETVYEIQEITDKSHSFFGKIYLNFYDLSLQKGESLADPSKNYLTTTASKFKKKKRSLRNYCKDPDEAFKKFEKFHQIK